MTIADRMKSPGKQGDDAPPDGWRARLELDSDDGGYIVTAPQPAGTPISHQEAIAFHEEDPEQWDVVKVRKTKWQQRESGVWLEAHRIELAPKGGGPSDFADIEALCGRIEKWRPRTTATKRTCEGTFVVPSGDLQLGKPDGGGSEATVDRFLAETELTLRRLRKALGRGKAETVVLPWLGDCIEGIVSQGGANNMGLDLTPTEQVRVYRRLIWAQVEQFAHVAERLIIPVVPGNHDEPMRVAGKQPTPVDDSWAIEGAVAVQDGVERNPELSGRVEFRFPGHDQMTITLDVGGTMIGMCHGHQFGRGADGWRTWWNDQGGGRTPIGKADVLLAAHRHHLRIQDHGDGRLFIQTPALDGGSQWFKSRKGDDSPSRMLSFWTKDGAVWGLDPVTFRLE